MRAIFQKAKRSRWGRIIKLTWTRWAEEDGDQRAAAFAYYTLLSLLPLILLLVTLGSLIVDRETATQSLVRMINHYTPMAGEQEREAVETLHGMLDALGKINLMMLPVLLWGSLKFLKTLIRTTNRIWRAPTYNWWQLPLKSLSLLGITASALLIGILLPVVARLLHDWFTADLQFSQWAFTVLFQLIPWLVLFYGLTMIFKLAPSRETRLSEVWPGALGATVLLWLIDRLFFVFVDKFAQFDALYGALGGVLAFLFWLYLSCCVPVLGVCFCAARAEQQENPHHLPQNHPA
jgi:YihY family inner membrane protein